MFMKKKRIKEALSRATGGSLLRQVLIFLNPLLLRAGLAWKSEYLVMQKKKKKKSMQCERCEGQVLSADLVAAP